MNESLFLIINGWAGQYLWLDRFMVLCTHYLIFILFAWVIGVGVWNRSRWRNMTVVAVASAFIARGGIVELIRRIYYHPRPWILSETHLLLAKEVQASFPSGHTTLAFALAMGVYLYDKKIGKWYFALAALIGFSRVYVGVHWPLDILGGIIVGAGTALIVDRLYRRFKHKIKL